MIFLNFPPKFRQFLVFFFSRERIRADQPAGGVRGNELDQRDRRVPGRSSLQFKTNQWVCFPGAATYQIRNPLHGDAAVADGGVREQTEGHADRGTEQRRDERGSGWAAAAARTERDSHTANAATATG